MGLEPERTSKNTRNVHPHGALMHCMKLINQPGSLQTEQSSWLGCRSLVAALESQMRPLAPDEVWCRDLVARSLGQHEGIAEELLLAPQRYIRGPYGAAPPQRAMYKPRCSYKGCNL